MQVQVIRGLDELDRLRDAWEALYARDPRAHFFVSWAYLRSWLPVTPHEWFVLAVRTAPEQPPVAFLPLARSHWRWRGLPLERQLRMGGKPFADYTGFLCDPETEEPALGALAAHVRDALSWERLILSEVLDDRLDLFLAGFPEPDFARERGPSLVSPTAPLADTWDEHLQGSMTSSGRYDVRRAMRNSERAPGFRVTVAGAGDLEAHIDAMMKLWQARWGALPPAELGRYEAVFRGAAAESALRLLVIWDGETPMAGAAVFVDAPRQTCLQYITAYDAGYAKQSPGRAVVGYALRDAIEAGHRIYDFLLGDEEYKYSFGARDRQTRTVSLVRRGWRSAAAKRLRQRHARARAAGSGDD